MHAIAHRGVHADTVRESALKVDWEKNPLPHQGIEPPSAAYRSHTLLTELDPHLRKNYSTGLTFDIRRPVSREGHTRTMRKLFQVKRLF